MFSSYFLFDVKTDNNRLEAVYKNKNKWKDLPMLLLLEFIPYIVLFLFGIVVGSFLNVCIWRLPKGESIVSVPSHCMSCEGKLRWYDLVPVFSYVLLRGRCRYCKEKISLQYPIIELINGLLWVLVCLIKGFCMTSLVYCLMASALLVLSIIDWRTFEIPIGINIFLGILAAFYTFVDRAFLSNHLIGAVCVSGFLFLLYILTSGRGIGGGDIKLMAVCGLLLGWQKILLAFILGCILGSVIHVIRMRFFGAGRMLALGPYLSAGIFLSALFGEAWMAWYISLLGI